VLTLAIDTSSPSGSLALLRDDNLIAVVGTSSAELYSSRVFRHLEFLLGELSLRLENFDLFAVAAGPGSFTGLRVGLAAVKGWAEVFGKPIAAVSALEAIAAQSRARSPKVISVMDARRGELYWGRYRRAESDPGAPEVFAGAISEVDGSVRPPLRLSVERVSLVLAPEIGRLGLMRAHRGELVDALTLDANYIRRSDAELHWKGSSGS
jgi:tRNA threonylcarbamoyladenosine biosynthesis protein TsaB